jgi:hypothetical protein
MMARRIVAEMARAGSETTSAEVMAEGGGVGLGDAVELLDWRVGDGVQVFVGDAVAVKE